MAGESVEVFFSYSHRDETLKDELVKHLSILQRQGIISGWHDRKILAGDEWDHAINQHLDSADIILLLISSDFIASSYCWDVEVIRAMERHTSGTALVIPIILRKVDWTGAPFAKLQALPKNAQPIKSWSDQDEALEDVAQGIRLAAKQRIEQRQQQQQAAVAATRLETAQKQSQAYRQEAEQLIAEDDGELSAISRAILDTLRTNLGLSAEATTTIEQELLRPYQIKHANLQQYAQVFLTALKHEQPLKQSTRDRLKRLQQTLALSDADIARIESENQPAVEQPLASKPGFNSQSLEPVVPVSSIEELASEKGIDYSRLQGLLAAQDWVTADRETAALMLRITDQEARGWLDEADLHQFPCTDLLTLDRLWSAYSQGKFGFRVQQHLWQAVNQDYGALGDRLGWRRADGSWLSADELTFSLDAPPGYLPVCSAVGGWAFFSLAFRLGAGWFSALTQRLEDSLNATDIHSQSSS